MKRQLLFVAIALVAGCGSTSVKVDRLADTEALAGEQIAVLLSRYSREGAEVTELASTEATVERCVRSAMERDERVFLPPAEFRKMVAADLGASPDALLSSLREPDTAARLAGAKLRYVVLLEGSYSTSESKWGGGGGQGAFAVGKEWEQYSSLRATILDLKHARIAGSITSDSTGKEGAGVGIIIIIPFPIYFTSMPESRACIALGRELARFISSP